MKDTKLSTTELCAKIAKIHQEAQARTREAEALAAKARELPGGSLEALDMVDESKGLFNQIPALQAEERTLQRQLIRELTAEAKELRERLPVATTKAREQIDLILGTLQAAVTKAEGELRKLAAEITPEGTGVPDMAISLMVRPDRVENWVAGNALDLALSGLNSALYSRNAEIQQIAALLGGR